MKRMLKFWIIGAAICFFGFCQSFTNGATLTGPENAAVGRLITINSDVEGDWLVYPSNLVDIAKDTDGKTLYFVARKEGEFTIIFCSVEKEKPVITQQELYIGKDVSPTPNPTPQPNPAPISKISAEDREAVSYALERVITGVDNKSINTPSGCRSAFKQALMIKGQVKDGNGMHLRDSLAKIADELTERTNFESAQTVKDSFEGFLQEIKNNG